MLRAYLGENSSMSAMDGGSGDKARLRSDLLAARQARSPDELHAARGAIRRHVVERAAGLGCVAAYVPLRTEPGSIELLAELRAAGVSVLVPVTLPDRDLGWVTWAPDGGSPPLGVEAIGRAELVVVPALAVALDGTRLGRGGGSYDRALTRCLTTASVAALVFDDEVLDWLPSDPWDVPVGAAVTPGGWRPLGRNTELGFAR
jgi:5-formyltetrahydrofolate cyclo-ligase